ncbi:peptide chain release factor N(5)-glutamine methyltransferase [Seminibacterium arietis]|uniref:Release factor glutamine methyltransferase n=1 Tax=Seminibacterium arietis TaxID=1173502 RepID=A0ABW3I8X9_9PAST
MNYAQWLEFAKERLVQNQSLDPFLNPKSDSLLLLEFVTKRNRASILAFSDDRLTEFELTQLTELLEKRCQQQPMAYILGEKSFWTLNLKVSPCTLIPRADTEILVEQALKIIKERLKYPQNLVQQEFAILDLGTGTGAIALSLASELEDIAEQHKFNLRIVGVDFLLEAVELARSNAIRHNLNKVEFIQSDWFNEINDHYDMIVANPPYIDENDEHLTQGDVQFEPKTALVSAEEGYSDLKHIIKIAPQYLKPQGVLLLEHGWQQANKVRSFFTKNQWQHVMTIKDYSGNDRVTIGQKNEK